MTQEEFDDLMREMGISDPETKKRIKRIYGMPVEQDEPHAPEEIGADEIVIPELSDDEFTGNVKKVVPNLKKSKRQDVKDFIKNEVLPRAVGGLIGLSISTALVVAPLQIALRSFVNDLPKISVTDSAIDELEIDDEIVWKLNEKTRFVFPRNGKITINMDIDLTDEEKNVIDEALEEANTILHLVDDDYELKAEYNKNKFKKLYSITVSDGDLDEAVLGNYRDDFSYYTLKGEGIYSGIANLDMDKIRSDEEIAAAKLKNTFLHEVFGHGIARMSDAYKVVDENGKEIYPKLTLLEASDSYALENSSLPIIYDVDIKNFLAKYGKDMTEEKAEALINEYKDNSKMYAGFRAELQSVKDNIVETFKTKYFKTIDVDKIQFTGLDGICYKTAYTSYKESYFGYSEKNIYEEVVKLPTMEDGEMSKSVGIMGSIDFGYKTENESLKTSGASYKKVDGNIMWNIDSSNVYLFRYEDTLFMAFKNKNFDSLALNEIGTIISEEEYNEFANNERFNESGFGKTEVGELCYNQFVSELAENGKIISPIDYEKKISETHEEGYYYVIKNDNIEAIFSPDEVVIKQYKLNYEGGKKLVSENKCSYSFYNDMIYTGAGVCIAHVKGGWYVADITYGLKDGLAINEAYTGEALAYFRKIPTTTSTATKTASIATKSVTETNVATEEKQETKVAENKAKEQTIGYLSSKKGTKQSAYSYFKEQKQARLEKLKHNDIERTK